MNWYLKVLKQYIDFEGRARRREFWTYHLVNFTVYISLMFIRLILFILDLFMEQTPWEPSLVNTIWIICLAYSLLTFLPSLSLLVRRLHDIGRDGWWILVIVIPVIGQIAMLVYCCLDGDEGDNEFGPDPKELLD